jgi:hypothetical protein
VLHWANFYPGIVEPILTHNLLELMDRLPRTVEHHSGCKSAIPFRPRYIRNKNGAEEARTHHSINIRIRKGPVRASQVGELYNSNNTRVAMTDPASRAGILS